jgi:adenylate cyclase
MARLSLSLLGAYQVKLDGTALTGFKSNKVRALLAFLAVEADCPHSRQSLAGLLWPELPDQAAAGALRNALSNLRRLLAAQPDGDVQTFLTITRETVQLNLDSDCWIDVHAFSRQLSALNEAPLIKDSQQPAIQALQSALQLYRGDLLEGFFVAGSIPFDEWLVLRSELYHSQAVAALQTLGGLLIEQGELLQAQQVARQHISLEPYSEAAYRQLMCSLALAGQRSEALLQYDHVYRLLAEELHTQPEMETIRLYEIIRSGDVTQAQCRPLQAPPQPGPVGLLAFVAREDQLAKLDEYLAGATQRKGSVAFVTGEPGSGKTALLAEFAQRAMQRHPELVAAFGSCTAQSSLYSPYLPFVDILNMLSGDIEGQRAGGAITPEHARRLLSLLPDTIQALADNGPDLVGSLLPAEALVARLEAFDPPGAGWKGRLASLWQPGSVRLVGPPGRTHAQVDIFGQVTAVLRELARRTTLLLIIDDLQWADTSSLSLLFHLGRRLSGRPILILAAYRSGQQAQLSDGADARIDLPGVVNELRRDFGDMSIDLDQADGQAFIEAFIDSRPNQLGESFRQALFQHTGGNPLFTIELLQSMQDRQQIVQNADGKHVAAPNLDWGQVPARVEGVIAERIRRLPGRQVKLLEAASVQGEVFIAEAAARLVDLHEDEARQILSTALARQARLVQADSIQRFGRWRFSRYRFRHSLFQKYIYGHLDPLERSLLHQQVAETLEEFFEQARSAGLGLGYPSIDYQSRLAWHFEQAGLIERSAQYLLQAAGQAVQLAAYYEALDLIGHGLALIQDLPETQERQQLELDLLVYLFIPQIGIYGWSAPQQRRVYDRMHALFAKIPNQPGDNRLFRVLVSQAIFQFTQGEFVQTSLIGEEILRQCEHSQQPGDKVMAYWILGQAYTFLGEIERAGAYLEQAQALYDPEDLRHWMPSTGIDLNVSIRGFQAVVWWVQGYPQRAWEVIRELSGEIRASCLPLTWYYAVDLIISFLTLLIQGSIIDVPLANEPALPALGEKHHSEFDLSFFRFYTAALNGFVRVEQGDAPGGIALMQSSIERLHFSGIQTGGPLLYYLLALAYLKAGQPAQGLELVDQRLAFLEKVSGHLFLPGFILLKGEILLAMALAAPGDPENLLPQAEACFLKALHFARQHGMKSWELKAAISLARFWKHIQPDPGAAEREEARRMLAEVVAAFSEGFDLPDLVQARQLMGAEASRSPQRQTPALEGAPQ